MGMNLKTCLFSLAALVAVAARADGMANAPAQDDPAALSTGRAAHAPYADNHRKSEAAPCPPEHATNSRDEAVAGSASGEPKRQDVLDDWNHLQFMRNLWDTP
jgi:hypothetical protein